MLVVLLTVSIFHPPEHCPPTLLGSANSTKQEPQS